MRVEINKMKSINNNVILEPNILFKTVASKAKIPIHITGTEVKRLASVLDKFNDSVSVFINGPIEVIPKRRLMETTAITNNRIKVLRLYKLFNSFPPALFGINCNT